MDAQYCIFSIIRCCFVCNCFFLEKKTKFLKRKLNSRYNEFSENIFQLYFRNITCHPLIKQNLQILPTEYV